MGVEFFPCGICKESICDAGPYYVCENEDCGANICEACYPDQFAKYSGHPKETVEDFMGDDLTECDLCSPKTLDKRIKAKEAELKALKSKKK